MSQYRYLSRLLPWAVGIFIALASATPAKAVIIITFDPGDPAGGVAANAILANQYAGIGVTFAAGTGGAVGITNPAASAAGFATNTSMVVVSIAGGDIGGGVNAPMSGNILHSFNGWLGEDGDPVLRINFATPIIGFFSVDFGGISTPASDGIFAVNAANVATQSVFATTTNTQTVSMNILTPTSSIVITEGDFNDWVGIDNINFTFAIPEPSTVALFAAAGLLLAAGWKRRHSVAAKR